MTSDCYLNIVVLLDCYCHTYNGHPSLPPSSLSLTSPLPPLPTPPLYQMHCPFQPKQNSSSVTQALHNLCYYIHPLLFYDARCSLVQKKQVFILTENAEPMLTPIIVQQPSRHFPLNLARIPQKQVIADFGRGSSVESESE